MSDETPAPEKIPALTLINGSENVPVLFLDGSTGTANVRLIPLKNLGDYLTNIGDINKLVELACGQPEGWSETLHDDSVYLLDETTRRLNDPRIDRYLKRQTMAVEKMVPMTRRVTELTNSLQTR